MMKILIATIASTYITVSLCASVGQNKDEVEQEIKKEYISAKTMLRSVLLSMIKENKLDTLSLLKAECYEQALYEAMLHETKFKAILGGKGREIFIKDCEIQAKELFEDIMRSQAGE